MRLNLTEACAGGKFVVYRAGEPYDAHEYQVQIGSAELRRQN